MQPRNGKKEKEREKKKAFEIPISRVAKKKIFDPVTQGHPGAGRKEKKERIIKRNDIQSEKKFPGTTACTGGRVLSQTLGPRRCPLFSGSSNHSTFQIAFPS